MRTKRRVSSILFLSVFVLLFAFNGFADTASAEPPFDIARLYSEKREAVVVVISELYEAKPSDNPQKKSNRIMPASAYHMLASSKIQLMPYVYSTTAENGEKTRYSLGTGFVIMSSGLIVTNYHVVEGAKTTVVEFADGRAYPAQVLGFDPTPENDIAILQISADRELPTLAFSQGSALSIGQKQFVIGHPFSTKYTASQAMISNLHWKNGILAVIQIHSSTLPGNSGSPLINERGEVNGIVFGTLEGAETQGLAIPSPKIERIIKNILRQKME